MNDRFLSMLGLCMKAGKLSLGHDASKQAIRDKTALLCIAANDASKRLVEEMRGLSKDIPLVVVNYGMDDIKSGVGKRAGVLTINDGGFSSKLTELINKEGYIYGS